MRSLVLVISCISWLSIVGQDYNKSVLDSIIKQSKRTNSNALIVYKNNKLIYKNYFDNAIQPIEAMSASKSIVSIAIGLLLDKSLIKSIDEPVWTLYPEWKQGNKKLITIKHLLNHTSGLQNVANAGIEIEVAPDVIQLALCAELDSPPGKQFSYNNKASNLLSGIVKKASGLHLDEFLQKYLFSSMGITNFKWLKDKSGNPLGMSGFQVLPEDLAEIGILILNKGKWNGKQLLSESWINQMLSPSESDNNYGFEWWLTYEKQALVLDEPFLNAVQQQTDSATFKLLQKLEGRYENGMQELRSKAMNIYSKEELASVGKVLSTVPPARWKIENLGKIVGYSASGYLGQNLIIIPDKKIVLVRMITAENFKKVPNNSEFAQLKTFATQL